MNNPYKRVVLLSTVLTPQYKKSLLSTDAAFSIWVSGQWMSRFICSRLKEWPFCFFPQILVSWRTVLCDWGLWPDADTPDPKVCSLRGVCETVNVVHISSQFTHFFFLPSHCGHIVGHVGLHLSLVCLFLAFSFILRHISAEALPHPVPSEYFVDLTWRVMMDKLIQTSEGCAHCSESQERFCLHTHTQAPSFSAAWTSFANNKDMAMCHFSTSRCGFERRHVLSRL